MAVRRPRSLAEGSGAIKRVRRREGRFVAVAIALTAWACVPSSASAQAPDESWRTLSTEHFRVTFPERLEPLARHAADRAEWAWDLLADTLVEPPEGTIDLVVTDHTDVSNGFATVFPSNRIVVFARPPTDGLSLGYYDDWIELVVLHELAHIVHLDHGRNPLGRLGRAIFGRVQNEWPFFPALAGPRWVIEGLATWYESRLTDAGRATGTYQEMQLRTAYLEGRFEDIGQASGESPLWPGGNRAYTYGARFFDHLLDRYGEDRMTAFVDAVAGQWVPYRLDAAGRDAFGVSLSDAWEAWEAEIAAEHADLDRRLARHGPITEPERLTSDARWGFHPKVSSDGETLVYVRSDGRSDMQLRADAPAGGAARHLTRTNGLATYDWLPDGRLVLSQLELHGPYRSYGDLYLTDLEGDLTRLTEQARVTDPAVFPDGRAALAVQHGDGTNALVRVDLTTGDISTVVPAEPTVHWALPSVSPDGRWIAATRWEPHAYADIVILDAADGRLVQRVTRDRAVDLAPRWSPDGRWLVWGSDRTGIPNILAAAVDPASGTAADPVLLTNVRTGAIHPSVDPSGRWLYLTGYHVDGWDVERVPFAPADAPAAPAAADRFEAEGPTPERVEHPGDVEPYSPGPTLRPTYWEFTTRDPLVFGSRTTSAGDVLRRREAFGYAIGAQTSGRDLVGRHRFGLYGRAFIEGGGRFEGGLSYAFAGLGNPILSVSATQRWASAGQTTATPSGAPAPDTLFIAQLERRLEGAVTLQAPTWRYGLSTTLSGALLFERRDLLDRRMQSQGTYSLSRPTSRLAEISASATFVTARSHSFQMGITRGISLFAQGRVRRETSLPDSLVGVAGADRSFSDARGRARAALPLWTTGRVTHVLALQATGGVASGAGAGAGHFTVGGASGRPEPITGADLFGGNFIFFPVRGYARSSRFGRYAWAGSAEYRFPIALVNRGLGAWPLHLDQIVGSIFVDAGNAWGPDVDAGGFRNPVRSALLSTGAEVTTELLAFFDVVVRLRGGIAVPLVEASGAVGYVRIGLPF